VTLEVAVLAGYTEALHAKGKWGMRALQNTELASAQGMEEGTGSPRHA
jgi:hypothetical protein